MNLDEITLILSGTPMSGFRYTVDKDWALGVTKEELVKTIRNQMIMLTKQHNMYELLETITDTYLHIHSPYNENSKEIYICTCNIPDEHDDCYDPDCIICNDEI